MGKFDDIDLYITEDGDLAIDDSGDLAIVKDKNYVIQTIVNRIKSIDIDWFYDESGASLEQFIGLPNIESNAELIIESVINVLTKDQFCDLDDILVLAKPTTASEVTIGLFVKTNFDDTPLSFMLVMDYMNNFTIRGI